jgi:hypothetical protein
VENANTKGCTEQFIFVYGILFDVANFELWITCGSFAGFRTGEHILLVVGNCKKL